MDRETPDNARGPAAPGLRVLGVDASLRSTGLAVVERRAGRLTAVEYAAVRNPASAPHTECLRRVHEELEALIHRTQPQTAALEAGFFAKNARTAMVLGEVRGVVLAVCARAGVPVYEYPPRAIKGALTGFGGAQKGQVGRMVCAMLGLTGPLQEDAADALATAICHVQHQGGPAALRPQPL